MQFFLRFFKVLIFFFLYLYINSFSFAKKNEMKPMDLMNVFCRNYMIFARIFPSNECGVGLWFIDDCFGRAPPPSGSSPWMVHHGGPSLPGGRLRPRLVSSLNLLFFFLGLVKCLVKCAA